MKNVGDLLLRWISEVEHGTVRNLLDSITWTARRYKANTDRNAAVRWVRYASMLGHLEVDWVNGHWSVAPPVLTRLPSSDGLLVLCGSRTAVAVERLNVAVNEANVEVHWIPNQHQTRDVPSPSTIMISDGDRLDHSTLAKQLGAQWIPCFALQAARVLPDLDFRGYAAAPLPGMPLEKLDLGKKRFVEIQRVSGNGLYRFTRADQKRPYQILRGGKWYATTYEEGIYLELASRPASSIDPCIRWKPDAETGREHVGNLVVDWGYPLPPLHSRAAVMCTGLIPWLSSVGETAVYRNVPFTLAKAIASSLQQKLPLIPLQSRRVS